MRIHTYARAWRRRNFNKAPPATLESVNYAYGVFLDLEDIHTNEKDRVAKLMRFCLHHVITFESMYHVLDVFLDLEDINTNEKDSVVKLIQFYVLIMFESVNHAHCVFLDVEDTRTNEKTALRN